MSTCASLLREFKGQHISEIIKALSNAVLMNSPSSAKFLNSLVYLL